MQGYASQFAKEISNLLWRVPRDLLLLLKTNDCLRSVDLALGQVCRPFADTTKLCEDCAAHACLQHA